MRAFTLFLAVSLFLPFTSSPLVAQTDQSPSNLGWVTLGLGGVGNRHGVGPAAVAEAAVQRGKHVFSLRVVSLLGFTAIESEAGVLYGRARYSRNQHSAVAVGPSIYGIGSGDETLGLALSAQVFWTSLRFVGIGLYGLANINAEEPFFGAMLALRFGKAR